MKMSEIRAQYPEYSDMPDEQLIIGLHRKFYSDMPFRDFNKKIEYDVLPPAPKVDVPEVKSMKEFEALTGPQQEAWRKRALERTMHGENEIVPESAYNIGGKVTDVTGSPAAGYAANVATQLLARPGFRTMPEPMSMANAPASYLMQSAVKPGKLARESGDAGRAIQTMLQEGINPTGGGMDKASRMADKLNAATNQAISASPETVNVKRVASRLMPLYEKVGMQVNPQADMEAVEAARKAFVASPQIAGKTDIPVALAQKLKSGTYAALGEKAYGELGSVSTEAQKQLARGLREEVIAKVPEVGALLKKESALRNVMEVASDRAIADANKNPLSLGTSIAAIMHDPLSAAGMWANASTRFKAMLAQMLYQSGRPEVAFSVAKAAQGGPPSEPQSP